MDGLAIAREYFSGWADEDLADVIWSDTGWPCFWKGEPEDSFRLQLAAAACRELYADFGYFSGEKHMDLAAAEWKREQAQRGEATH